MNEDTYIDRGEALYWQFEAKHASNVVQAMGFSSSPSATQTRLVWQVEREFLYRMARNAMGMS